MTGFKEATSSSFLPSFWIRGGVVPPYQTSQRQGLRRPGCNTTKLKKKYKHPHLNQTQNFESQNGCFIHASLWRYVRVGAHLLLPVGVGVAMVAPYQTSRRQKLWRHEGGGTLTKKSLKPMSPHGWLLNTTLDMKMTVCDQKIDD